MKVRRVILVVVACAVRRQAIGNALRAADFVAVEVTTGEEAARTCVSGLTPDAFFVDLNADYATRQFVFECSRNKREILVVAACQDTGLHRRAIYLARSSAENVSSTFEQVFYSNLYRLPERPMQTEPCQEGA